jgi:hypothetical protein
MKANNQQRSRGWKQGGALLAAGLLAGHRLVASSVLMEPPPVSTTTLSEQDDAANNVMNVFLPSAWNLGGGSAALLQYGPIILHPHVSYSLTYGSGLNSGSNGGQDTYIQQLSPGITVNLGQHWAFDYTAGIIFYSDKQFRNAFNHSASLNWNAAYEDWIFGLVQSFTSNDTPLTETAAQTSQQQYLTTLTTGYTFNSKMSAEFEVSQDLNYVTGLQNSYNWSTMEWLNYEFWPRLKAGIGAGAGYTKVSDNSGSGFSNPDFVNEQLQGRLNWRATDKLSIQTSAGFEEQQFMAAGYGDSLNPIFSASIQYQPFQWTQIYISAARTVSSSDYYISAQSSEITTVSLNLNQRLFVKYNLNLGIAYDTTDYTSTLSAPGISTNTKRSDNGYVFSASIGRNFLNHGNWAINYQYSDNHSSIAGYSQQSNQIGFQVGFSY